MFFAHRFFFLLSSKVGFCTGLLCETVDLIILNIDIKLISPAVLEKKGFDGYRQTKNKAILLCFCLFIQSYGTLN